MSTFIGSSVSGLQIDDSQITLISNSVNAIQLLTANNNINLGGYSLTNLGALQQNLDAGSHKIINLATPTANNDAANKTYIDNGFYANTITLDNITAPTSSVSLNSHKIINLATPTLDTDAATKLYVDDAISSEIDSQITSTSTNTKIVVSDTNNLTAFTNNSINTINIDTVSVRPLIPISMGGLNKIMSVLDPTLAQDVSTKNYVDTRTINTLATQTADYSANNHKITNLQLATSSTDAMNLGQNLSQNQWIQGYLTADITTGFTTPYVVNFTNTILPNVLSPIVTANITYSSGQFTLGIGKYKVNLVLEAQYIVGTDIPVQMQLLASTSGVISNCNIITNRAPDLNTSVITTMCTVINNTVLQNYSMNLIMNVSRMGLIGRNTQIIIQQLS